MLNEAVNWIAPVATIIAAMMTAANLGARLTGWGFVVFTLASLCWIGVGLANRQTSLIVADTGLTVINLLGIWRWLGKQRAYEDGGKSAKAASRKSETPTLFTATGIAGIPVTTAAGEPIGKAVEALIECRSGTISYVVVSTAATDVLAETLRAVPRSAVVFKIDQVSLTVPREEFDSLAPLHTGDWPAAA